MIDPPGRIKFVKGGSSFSKISIISSIFFVSEDLILRSIFFPHDDISVPAIKSLFCISVSILFILESEMLILQDR